MTVDELKQCLASTQIRLKETETNLDKYKLLVHKDQDQSRDLVDGLKEQLGLTSEMFQTMAPDLQTTCRSLRQQRDQLVEEIRLLSQSHKEKGPAALENALTIQYQSIQQEIQTARDVLHQLDHKRDVILEEMVLLNTKNAELNTMNNDLSRHIAHRELETKALIASTQFLRSSSSTETTISTASTYPPPSRPSTSTTSTNSSSSATGKKPTRRQQAKKDPEPTTETRMFAFSRPKNVFANRGLHKKKSSECENVQPPKASQRPPSSASSSSASLRSPTDPLEVPQKKRFSMTETSLPNHLHQFIETKFLRPTRCEWCQEKMWRSHELKCQEKTKFGRDLVLQAKEENQLIPLVVQCCVEAVDFRDCHDLGSRLAKMNQVFKTIPKENFHTIHYFMCHLDRIQQHSDTNLMVTKNLATVFGPTLIRNRDEKDDMIETSQKIHVIDFILHHINELFETSPPTSP
ncbi:hypothetical protein BC941DRAFT_450133 [Chlamydoabsidia padenii]|nr:hypothetical protein BC941DRAFT_450133 [Chlamydoabsidia padenii]